MDQRAAERAGTQADAAGQQLRTRTFNCSTRAQLWPRRSSRPPARGVLAKAGIDAEVKAALVAQTEQAVARGVFGAPTCFFDDEMFFGQDRLEFVREAAAAG
jgi:DSBA-like thioredoxin domain